MIGIVQVLQAVSGVLWLGTALYITPRIFAAWSPKATRAQILIAPSGFVGWILCAFSLRWFVWPHAMAGMVESELMAWASLYGGSALCAVWMFTVAFRTRGQ